MLLHYLVKIKTPTMWCYSHISTSGFASTSTDTAVFALFLPVQSSDCN